MTAVAYGIDAHLLHFGPSYRAAGISRSIHNLLRFLPAEATADERLIAYAGPGQVPARLVSQRLAFVQSRLPTRRPLVRMLWEQLALPAVSARAGISALHCPAYAAPIAGRVPVVVTVHDLSFIRFPWAFNRGNRLYLTAMTRWSARHAAALVAVSESTRDEMVRLLRVAPERIAVIHHGIEPEFHPATEHAEVESFRQREGLPDRFVLCVATLEPRKNLGALIRAYARAGGASGLGRKLVLAGGKGWGYRELFTLVEELGLRGDVLLPGFVPMADLPLWYNAADLFVYPSRYEGFGMPVLEAMACGVPTVTTTTPALAEVAGAACVLVDADDTEQMADALSGLLRSPGRLSELREAGLRRAGEFSWHRSAQQHLDTYRSVTNRPRHRDPRDHHPAPG
jgi:glycosyltransferase involved in cell wall biosynthesis